MGSELVGSSSSQEIDRSSEKSTPFVSYSEIFEKNFPLYLSIGMTYDQYWNDDCQLTRYYLKAFKLKQEREISNDNYKLWLQGLYIYEAICDVSPILHAFAPKGTRVIPYRSKPIPITQKEIEEQEQQDRNERLLLMKQKLIASCK